MAFFGPKGLRSGMILYLAADLIWATKIKGTAEALGIAARPVRSLEMLEARLADSPVAAVVLDLDKPEEALAFIGRLRGEKASAGERQIKVLAWGPHVATDLLAAAKAAGADMVMTRGAFDHKLSEILVSLAGHE
jgi:hypothetical protein